MLSEQVLQPTSTDNGFSEWGELLVNTVITSAIVDRLLHDSHALNIRGGNYRLLEKRQAEIFSSHQLLGGATENGNENHGT